MALFFGARGLGPWTPGARSGRESVMLWRMQPPALSLPRAGLRVRRSGGPVLARGRWGARVPAGAALERPARRLRAARRRTRKKNLSYDEFALQWKQSDSRSAQWQAKVLEDSLQGQPRRRRARAGQLLGRQARPARARRQRRGGSSPSWFAARARSVRAMRSGCSPTRSPQRDITACLDVLTQRRRDGLPSQVEGFVTGLGKRINDADRRVSAPIAPSCAGTRTASATASCSARRTTSGASTTSTSAPRPRTRTRPTSPASRATAPEDF